MMFPATADAAVYIVSDLLGRMVSVVLNWQIGVHKIVEAREKNTKHFEANKNTRGRPRGQADLRIETGPTQPEIDWVPL